MEYEAPACRKLTLVLTLVALFPVAMSSLGMPSGQFFACNFYDLFVVALFYFLSFFPVYCMFIVPFIVEFFNKESVPSQCAIAQTQSCHAMRVGQFAECLGILHIAGVHCSVLKKEDVMQYLHQKWKTHLGDIESAVIIIEFYQMNRQIVKNIQKIQKKNRYFLPLITCPKYSSFRRFTVIKTSTVVFRRNKTSAFRTLSDQILRRTTQYSIISIADVIYWSYTIYFEILIVGRSMIRRSATNDLAIPKSDSESNTFSKWPFAEKSFAKIPPTLSTRKLTEYSNIPNSLDKLDSSLFKNKYSLVGDPETVAHNSIEPLLEDKVTISPLSSAPGHRPLSCFSILSLRLVLHPVPNQSAICSKDDLQSTSQIMSRSQTNMEVIPPCTHSTSYLSNSNTIVTNTRGNLNNPSSLDNETLTTLNRIHESNKWKVNSGAVSTTHISDNMRIPNLISKNASKPLRKLDEIESDNEKNVDVAERLFCNEAPFQCTDETAKSLVRSPNSRYLYSYQNKPNDRLKENDTSKNNKNETFCSQEFRCDSYEFPTQQTLTQTHQTYAENNGIFCSRNDCFTQPQSILRNSQENRVTCKNSETSRTVNWSPTSILYEDNLLKQLLDEKPDIIKSYNKRKSEDKQLENQDGIMAKTYIKKYRKNNIRIYKIKRRFRTSVEETYVPKEHKLINKFLNQAEDETTPDDLSSDTKNRTEYQTFLGNSINRILKDKSLIFSKFSDTVPLEINSSDVLTKIEEIMVQLLSDYECGKSISLNIPSIANCVFRDDREIYYQLKTDVCTQRHTDSAIRIISRMLNVGMWALNITAQKGLVYGNMKLVMDTGETINCNVAGTLVPNDVMNICEIQSQAFFILVVEKESIFNKLLEEDLPNKLTKPFILITGKGYPDLNTQLFLKKLWMVMEIPVFIFVDADPDGISIMLTYRFGSKTNVHLSEYLAIPKAKWIGVFPTEILNVGANYEILNNREERKATSLLQLQCVQENPKIQKQIQTCLDTGVKASIEALIKSESYLSNQYLPSKFLQNDLI
ncbi:hypothetical protein HUJ04_003173 [Dendroctonus ponderosae]|nr:hypothetical protein HUJ04_003173 [Dendroctonus ponderosae]